MGQTPAKQINVEGVRLGPQFMKTILLWCSLAFLLTLVLVPFARAGRVDLINASSSTGSGRLAVFDDVWETVRNRYYDSRFNGLDWDGLRMPYRKLAAEASSNAEFYDVLRQMLGLLNDSHTRVFAPEEKFDWRRPRFVSIGLKVSEVDGLPTVVEVERGSEPERAGVTRGDVIQTVDGEPAIKLIKRRFPEAAISLNASTRTRATSMVLDGAPQTYLTLRWQNRAGHEQTAKFRREWRQLEPGVRFRREHGKYLVVEVDAFTRPIAARFAREFNGAARKARGIVLDLRSNGGGEAEAMIDIASAFLGAGTSLGQFVDRSGATLDLATYSRSRFIPHQLTPTTIPLVVLISERTSSAAEILTEALRASQRAMVIGSHTCGCVLAIRTRHVLPDGGALDVSELDYRTPAGLRLEGRGLKPDLEVRVTHADLHSGRDRALETALDKLAHAMIPRKVNPQVN